MSSALPAASAPVPLDRQIFEPCRACKPQFIPLGEWDEVGRLILAGGWRADCPPSGDPPAQFILSFSDAISAPFKRLAIFWKAMSRATSGEPCFGLTSMLNGEKPQSSVAPSLSL